MKKDSIIIHHVGYNHSFYTVNSGHLERTKEWHKKKYPNKKFNKSDYKSSLGWYIYYHYFIDNSGKLFQGRNDDEDGAHKKGWNERAIGICLRGNLEERKPTKQQLNTLRSLLQDLQKCHGIPKEEIYAHKELSATLCPGKNLMPFIEAYRKYIPETEIKKAPEVSEVEKEIKTPQRATESVTEPTKHQLQTQLNKIKVALLKLKQKLYEIIKGV